MRGSHLEHLSKKTEAGCAGAKKGETSHNENSLSRSELWEKSWQKPTEICALSFSSHSALVYPQGGKRVRFGGKSSASCCTTGSSPLSFSLEKREGERGGFTCKRAISCPDKAYSKGGRREEEVRIVGGRRRAVREAAALPPILSQLWPLEPGTKR